MIPIYDRNVELIGWYDGVNLFSLDLNWLAFYDGGDLFSSHSLEWLGPVDDGLFLDTGGKAVVWLDGCSPSGSPRPRKPSRPLRPSKPFKPLKLINPARPLKPLTPLAGWSTLTGQQWLNA